MLLLYRLVLHVCDSVIDLQTREVKLKSICNKQTLVVIPHKFHTERDKVDIVTFHDS